MAATAAGGGGSPPRGGNENTNNGNLTGLNALVESISDINLSLLQGSSKFLSAKNSVELHRGKRFFPYRSLPSVLHPSSSEEMEDEPGTSATEGEEEQEENSSPAAGSIETSRNSSGRNVNWSDLHATPGHALLTSQAHRVENNEWSSAGGSDSEELDERDPIIRAALLPAKVTESPSHTSLYLHSPDDLSVLHVRSGSNHYVFGEHGAEAKAEMCEDARIDLHVPNTTNQNYSYGNEWNEGSQVDYRERRNLLQPPETDVYPTFPIPKAIGGSPSRTSQEHLFQTLNNSHVINEEDGLGTGLDKLHETPRNVFFTPTMADSVAPELYGLSKRSYLDMLNPLAQLPFPDPVISVYFQEEVTNPIPPTLTEPIGDQLENQGMPLLPLPAENKSSAIFYDGDDDIELDKKPELKMPSPDDIPVPDPSYVRATVPESFRPLIAQTYKKDCRTWLWKSKTQREAVLRQQAENGINGATSSESSGSDTDTSGSLEEELTTRLSKLDFKTNA